jgi:hypothetical protein
MIVNNNKVLYCFLFQQQLYFIDKVIVNGDDAYELLLPVGSENIVVRSLVTSGSLLVSRFWAAQSCVASSPKSHMLILRVTLEIIFAEGLSLKKGTERDCEHSLNSTSDNDQQRPAANAYHRCLECHKHWANGRLSISLLKFLTPYILNSA